MTWGPITAGGNVPRPIGCGSGDYGAPRSGNRIHQGEDIFVVPGETIFAPFDGVLTREGQVYPDDSTYRLIEIVGDNVVKIMYAIPYSVGFSVKKGEPIGTAQKISDRYSDCGMVDHLHIEIDDGDLDPAPFLYPSFSVQKSAFSFFVFGLFLVWKSN